MSKRSFNFYTVSLILLCLFQLISNLFWLSLNTAPLPWDQAGHTRLAIGFVNFFSSYDALKIVDYFSVSNYYPPLIHTIVAFLSMIFGHPVFIGGLTITIFYIASIILTYKYFSELFEDKSIGLLSSAIFSFFPIVFEHSRWFLLEIPLLTFVLASLLYLLKSKNFTQGKNTFLFFVFVTLSVMTKWLALIYLLIPFLFSFYKFLKTDRETMSRSFRSIKNGLFFLFGITLPWYIINFSSLFSSASVNLKAESSDPQGILNLKNWIFYLYTFINFQVTFLMAILFILAVIFYALSKDKNKLFIFGYMLFVYLVFSLVPNKDWRYTFPILPFAASIIAYFLVQIQKKAKIIGSLLIAAVLLFQIGYFSLLSFRFPINISYQRAFNIPLIGWIDYVNISDNLAHVYSNGKWPQKEILQKVNALSPKGTSIICLIDQERFNAGNLLLERDLLKLKSIEVENPPASLFNDDFALQNYLSKFEYALVAKEASKNPATRNIAVFDQVEDRIEAENKLILKSYILPNGDTLILYRLTK